MFLLPVGNYVLLRYLACSSGSLLVGREVPVVLFHREHLQERKRPWSLPGPRGGGNGGVLRLLYAAQQTPSLGPETVTFHGAPGHNLMWSRREAAPRKVTREERGTMFLKIVYLLPQVLLQSGFNVSLRKMCNKDPR